MRKIINGLRYDTETATLIASDRYWDGHNWDRHGRNQYLYVTKKGNFFTQNTTRWSGERDRLIPIDKEEAKSLYEILPEQELSWEDSFGEVPEEA